MPALGALWRRQAAALLRRGPARASRPTTPSALFFRPNPAMRARNRRFQSTDPKPPQDFSTTTTFTNTAPQSRRISRILAGASRFMPMRLRGALHDLRSAPLSHVFAFLVLHEITAVLPVVGLTYAFYTLDVDMRADWMVSDDGLNKWTNYFRKKRWFGLEPKDDDPREEAVSRRGESVELLEEKTRANIELPRATRDGMARNDLKRERRGDAGATTDGSTFTSSSEGTAVGWKSWAAAGLWKTDPQLEEPLQKILIQVTAAYTITKMLLVPRIALSLWLTPWFARGFVGFRQALSRKRW
ncbi:hypothetical protein F4782DRAFT_543380 [Xylaria castorea]|nr:hypothetical protein F4782DRAFT_543380 [Xylaria castorea]